MFKTLLIILVLFVSHSVIAAGDMPSLQAGNIAAGGAANFSFGDNQTSYLYVAPEAEYFFTDHFSFGGNASASINNDEKFYSLGPSATYYFWQSERWASYVGAGLNYNFNSYNSHYWYGVAKIGVEYFFTPSVALGPVYHFERFFGADSGNQNYHNILVQFSIYL